MKKLLLKILILCFTICSTLCVLTACGESPISFKLNFIVDNEIVKTIDTTGNEKIALPTDPEKEGFSFDGWFWDKDVWERPFTANSLLDAPLSSDMSVYAKFTKNHEHDYIATITAPTCTEKGYTTYTCDCGASYVDDYVDELGHEFTNYVYDNNATYSEDGTKTAVCNRGCGATDILPAENTKLTSGIEFKTLAVDGNNVYGKIPNAQTEFDFLTEIEKKGNVTYYVSRNLSGDDIIVSKTAEPNVGNNKYYILVYQNGELLSRYNITIRRREIYGVSFNTNGGNAIEPQYIEEDSLATEPTTAKAGYTFIEWDYDFTTPITNSLTVNASWAANTNTPYKVEYYLENLSDYDYTLYETENLTGTTDTTAIAEIKEYEHFTHTAISESNESANINGDGTTVLKVYYTRNEYTIRLVAGDNVTVDNPYDGKYKYGYLIEEISATTKLGYDWQGWYNLDDEFITKNLSFVVEEDVNYVAKATLKEEMSNFNFNSTENTCNITGIKNKSLTEIIIPDSVTSISAGAFRGCSSLERITIPFVGGSKKTASDTYQYPFGYIFGTSRYTGGTATGQYYYGDSTSSTTNTTYYIPSSLKTVTVTGGNILYGAFYNCNSLESVIIGNSVTSISSNAFSGCSSLQYNEYGNALYLGNDTNKYLVLVKAKSTDITTCSINNNTRFIMDCAFFYCNSLTSITIPNSVTSIGEWVFSGCSSLTSVTIGNSVTSIGDGVFYGCSSLESITIPNSVTSIGESAFYNCSSLTSITIPDSVTSIGDGAFLFCSSLTSVTIPDSVTSIGNYAFQYCFSLTSITFNDTTTWYMTTDTTNWQNKMGGTQTDVTNAFTNATYFTSTYYNYYWYKR